jgi:hypothetical protein
MIRPGRFPLPPKKAQKKLEKKIPILYEALIDISNI